MPFYSCLKICDLIFIGTLICSAQNWWFLLGQVFAGLVTPSYFVKIGHPLVLGPFSPFYCSFLSFTFVIRHTGQIIISCLLCANYLSSQGFHKILELICTLTYWQFFLFPARKFHMPYTKWFLRAWLSHDLLVAIFCSSQADVLRDIAFLFSCCSGRSVGKRFLSCYPSEWILPMR